MQGKEMRSYLFIFSLEETHTGQAAASVFTGEGGQREGPVSDTPARVGGATSAAGPGVRLEALSGPFPVLRPR